MVSPLAEARAIAQKMPRDDAQRLRCILSIRTSPAKRRSLIVDSGLPLGALIVADTFHRLHPTYRRCA